MANSVALDYDNPPEINRALINQRLNPDVGNLKKRKFFIGAVEQSSLPASKHKCCDIGIDSEQDSLLTKALQADNAHTQLKERQDDMDVLDMGVKSGEVSNSFPGDSRLSAGVKYYAEPGDMDSCDEASTSWSNSGSSISWLESTAMGSATYVKEGIMFSTGGHYPCHDTQWDDNDLLQECISEEQCIDSKQLTVQGFPEFLSSSGINPNLSVVSSERWSIDQGAQLETRKPTIDQEFEQYFSMLML